MVWETHPPIEIGTPALSSCVGNRAKIADDFPRPGRAHLGSGKRKPADTISLYFQGSTRQICEAGEDPVVPGCFARFHAPADQVNRRRNIILLKHGKRMGV